MTQEQRAALIEAAKARRAEMDAQTSKLDEMRTLIEDIGSSPSLSKLLAFLKSLKDILKAVS